MRRPGRATFADDRGGSVDLERHFDELLVRTLRRQPHRAAGVNTLNRCPSPVSAAASWWKTGTAR